MCGRNNGPTHSQLDGLLCDRLATRSTDALLLTGRGGVGVR